MTMPMGSTGSMGRDKMTGDKIPKGYRMGQTQQFTPEQMQLFQQMFSQVSPGSFLSQLAGGDEGMFEQMEAPAWRDFQEAQGQLASRFSGLGGKGSAGVRRSSGFSNAMNQQSSDFAQQLQSNRLGLQRQAIQDLMGLSGNLLQQRPYERNLIKKAPSFWEQLLLGINETGKEMAPVAAKYAMGGF